MAKNELYEEHLQEMFGMNLIDNYSDEEIYRVFDRLLQCLPNHGKLYKYRSMEGQAFNYAYDGLEKGYIYLARANTAETNTRHFQGQPKKTRHHAGYQRTHALPPSFRAERHIGRQGIRTGLNMTDALDLNGLSSKI